MIPVYQTGSDLSDFTQVKNLEDLDKLTKATTDKCVALLFWADWHEPCHHLKNMMSEMTKVNTNVKFAHCNSDEATDIVDKYDVNEVPTLAFIHPFKNEPEIVENPSPEILTSKVDA